MKKNLILTGIVFASGILTTYAQTAQERAQIIKNYDKGLLTEMARQSEIKAKAEKAAAITYAKKNNIPVIIKHKDGSTSELMRIDEHNVPIYYTNNNVNAARSTRVNHLNTGGSLGLNLDGQNMIVGVWDGGGVRTTHQELNGRVTVKDNATTTGDPHATHVGGTIAASGVTASAKGMASAAKIYSYQWDSDVSEMTTEAAAGLLVSNHSYGYRSDQLPAWYFGAYISESKAWDDLLFNAPYYTICKAAGNDGTFTNSSPLGGSSSAYDKLSGAATSKNVIVVANAQDASVSNNGDLNSVLINSSSSQGPTDDLRIKPDIAGNGTTLYSSVSSSNTAYGTMTGTSMASPNVAGSITLVQQHFKNVTGAYMRGAALRGLALHTADDAGANGPDVNFGWGLLNAKRMAEVINTRNTTSLISDKTLNNNATDNVTVNADGVSPLTVSISWYDRGGTTQTSSQLNNTTTKRLVNDLDLRVSAVSTNTTSMPWVLTSRSTNAKQDNNTDNFERVDLGIVPAGQYTIAVSHKGSLTGGSQNYTLIVTGRSNNVAACNAPNNLSTADITTGSATLNWVASASANTGYTVEYKAAAATQWIVVYTGTNTSTPLTGLATATNYNWRVKTNCSATESSAYADASFTTTGGAACNAPTNLASSNITSSGATISWTASTTANTGYTVEYKAATATQWISAGTTTATNISLSSLSAATAYNYRVRTNCSASSTSSDATGNLTTAAAPTTSCAQAFEPNATIAAAYDITLNTDYQAAIATSGDVDYYKITVPTNSINTVSLTNLTHDVDLAIQSSAGQNLAVSENGGSASEQISATFSGGIYYIKVYPYSGFNANNCYTLRVSSGSATAGMADAMSSIDNANPISAYPNPASNLLTIKISAKMAKDALIKVYDVLGKEQMSLKAKDTESQLDISSLPAGIYHITVSNERNQYHLKFTKK
ncbi:hypothetical protein DBR32_01515 [Taibaiella sp. KBW10]|uniref:S8 family serine peptidase n=1 Tax=Taibaiella sp. KBW10 TaxID=2153357 RepID=UPI000F5A64A7|nr:S8 family serine peptidase [Taibaiella sp. KBW10]RQO32314.1 hypothetical protein DBR32_01515 [Taibaiella sp. KBW10]